MSQLSATQIPKPGDPQAFERACVVLWRCLLNDPNVQRNGRSGQRQAGVDIFGIRNNDPRHLIGVQCKLKGAGQKLHEREVRNEFREASAFRPALREFVIATTAPDNAEMQRLARELAVEAHDGGWNVSFQIWGWNTLEERISEHLEAYQAFDASFGVFGTKLVDKVDTIAVMVTEVGKSIEGVGADVMTISRMASTLTRSPGDSTLSNDGLEKHLDGEIDSYRTMGQDGRWRTALTLFEGLLSRVGNSATGRILFRLKANMGICRQMMGGDAECAALLAEAYRHAPEEPKAIANMALSLLISGETRRLAEFTTLQLAKDPDNEHLASYAIQGARHDQSLVEPLDLVPAGLRDRATVIMARVDHLRCQGRHPEWWEAARRALSAFPDDPFAIHFAAEADVDEITRDPGYLGSGVLTREARVRLAAAVEKLAARWAKVIDGEGAIRPEHVGLCCNLLVGLRAVDDLDRAVIVARQGLAAEAADHDLAMRSALVGMDSRDDELVALAFPKMSDDEHATLLRFRYHVDQGHWDEVARFEGKVGEVPVHERVMAATAARLARLKLDDEGDPEDRLRGITNLAGADPRAHILISDHARSIGLEAVADLNYRLALDAISPDSHLAARHTVARAAASRGAWGTVVDLLDGRVDEAVDKVELRLLCTGMVNDAPIHRRALAFFDRLPDAIAKRPTYLRARGLLHFNRGALGEAEDALRSVMQAEPNASNLLALLSTLRRRGGRDEAPDLLGRYDVAHLDGTPGEKMFLAQALMAAGRAQEAFAFGYRTLRAAPDDPKAAMRYCGLALGDPEGRFIIPAPVVAIDAWVSLENGAGEVFSFIVEEGADLPSERILSPNHAIVAAAMGMAMGESFEVAGAFGPVTWRVTALKHKHLHALHDVMQAHETRFPDSHGLHRVDVADGNMEPVLAQIRRASEAGRQVADLYLEQHIPLSMLAAFSNGSTLGLASYVASLNFDVRTCVGTEHERFSARETARRGRACGAVLDAYAAWTAATLDVLDVLVAVFGRLVVPRSAMDELRMMQDGEVPRRARSMSVRYVDGSYVAQETTAGEREGRGRYIDGIISRIEAACSIEAAVAADRPSELAATMTATFGSHVLDVADLAAAGGHVLVSEDLHLRQVVQLTHEVGGIWIQAALAHACDLGIITRARYVDALVGLAARRHGHVPLQADVMIRLLEADDDGLERLSCVSRFIGRADADMGSHLEVVRGFFSAAWSAGFPSLKLRRATSLLLDRLTGGRRAERAMLLAYLKEGANWSLHGHIDSWATGHLVSAAEMSSAAEELRRVSSAAREAAARALPARPRKRHAGGRRGS